MEDYKEILELIEKNYLMEDFLYLLGESEEIKAKIIEKYMSHPNPFVRNAAVTNLGDTEYSISIKKKLIELLDDEDENVKISAIETLVSMEAWNAKENIYELLKDKDNLVRAYAIWGIGELSAKNYESDLVDLYEDEIDIIIKASLCETLYKFTKEEEYLIDIIKLLEGAVGEELCFVSNSLANIAEFDFDIKERAKEAIILKSEEVELPEIMECLEKNISSLS